MITNYTSLQTAVAAWLDRSDLTTNIPEFVQLAESRFHKDERIRTLTAADFDIDAENENLPADFKALESLELVGPTHYRELITISLDQMSRKQRPGTAGAPRFVALRPGEPVGGVAQFSPAPDTTYDGRIRYWAGISTITSGGGTNWLITAYPDIYLFGSLAEAAPFLHDDARIAVWESKLEAAIEQLRRKQQESQFGGTLRRQFRTFGG